MNHLTQTVVIDGITCDACIKIITKRFSKIGGVTMVVAVEKSGVATVCVEEKLPAQIFEQALLDTGYTIVSIN